MSLSVCEHNTPQVLAERIEAPTALRMKLLTVKLPGAEDEPDDEVAFWRGFVTWWAREKAEPVPERAWQALALAQRRAAQRQDQHYDGGGGGQ